MGYFKKINNFGDKRGPSMFNRGFDRDAETHKTNCSECGAMCEVPFRPNGKKPVYCRNCYKGKATTTSFTGQPFPSSRESSHEGAIANDLNKQFSILGTKIDRLTAAIEAQTRAHSSHD